MSRLGLVPVLVLLLTIPCPGQAPAKVGKEKNGAAKGEKKDPTTRELLQWMEEPLDVTPYQSATTFKEVLERFTRAFAAKGKDLPLFVDVAAFRDANPDAADIYDTRVKFPPRPRRMKFETALRFAVSRLPTNNGTFVVRRGCVEVTTLDSASPARLLAERVTAAFTKRPLAEALEELSDLTGATIILDPRVGEKAQTPVTARFRNTISLEGAVRLLAEMSGLQVRVEEENVLFITSKRKEGPQEKQADLRFRDRPLDLALRELTNWSGTSIILDPRAESPPWDGIPWLDPTRPPPATVPSEKFPVSAVFKAGTSPRAAATILAKMAGLEAVAIENAVYVTTPQVAKEMRGRAPKQRPPGTAPPK
jgi:hypothetical protein